MTTDVEFRTIKELYDTIKDEDSASYSVFVKKLRRLAQENPRTYNRISRQLGIEPPKRQRRTKRSTDREFVAYDGEGWGTKLVLLASSKDEYTINPEGLSSLDCLDFLSNAYDEPVIRVFFSFGYDVNHIIKDIPDDDIETLLRGYEIDYEGHRISYIPSKIFRVNNIQYFDVFGFFQTSFINVVRKMLGDEYVTDELVEGKAGRGSFETWDAEKLISYNRLELDLLVQILNKLRDAFRDIDVDLKEWYGPGAVAKYWFKKHNIYPREKHRVPDIFALNGAYFGGRFEQLQLGRIKNVYEYDIHSAYPAAMVNMPYFLSWKPSKTFVDDPFSIWHLSFDLRNSQHNNDESKNIAFLPLPVRDNDGRICFPLVGKGWYWHSEVKLVLDFFPDAKLIFHNGYVAQTQKLIDPPNEIEKPFKWVGDLYTYRQELKDAGNLSQYAIKVGINSLYGKTAQRIGQNPFFSLAWAGYITSTTRAKLARAGYEAGSQNVIGFATDAIFTTTPLNVPQTDNLGDWEESRFDEGIFIQSGVYRLIRSDGKVEDRYRGSPLRNGIDDILKQLKDSPREYPRVKVGRFISHSLAIKAKKAYGPLRLQFVRVDHVLKIDAPYKRHYLGFLERIMPDGTIISNYAKLLKEPIYSIPKVWIGDDNPFTSYDYLWSDKQLRGVESQPPPIKDKATQSLIDEANRIATLDEDYDEVSLLEGLPVVEDDGL